MRKIAFTVFVFTLLASTAIYSECLPREKSYYKYVTGAMFSKNYKDNMRAIKSLRKHLKCYPDKEVYLKIATIYEFHGKYYLAEIAYKKAGATDDFNRIREKRFKNLAETGKNHFKELALIEQQKQLKMHRALKAASISLLSTGIVAAGVGLSLFIHERTGGSNNRWAQYSLMMGGLSLMGVGLTLYGISDIHLNKAEGFKKTSELYSENYATTPNEFYKHSGIHSQTKIKTSKTFFKIGISLILLSAPLAAVAYYGFKLSLLEYAKNSDCSGFDCMGQAPIVFLIHAAQLITFFPSLASLAGGIVFIVKGAKWKKLKQKETLFTLNNVSPMINPITKTYGISMGFSF